MKLEVPLIQTNAKDKGVDLNDRATDSVGLDKVRTCQRDRFISIPVVRDEETEARKKAEITALEKQINGIKRDL